MRKELLVATSMGGVRSALEESKRSGPGSACAMEIKVWLVRSFDNRSVIVSA